jgi:hypothetical protein
LGNISGDVPGPPDVLARDRCPESGEDSEALVMVNSGLSAPIPAGASRTGRVNMYGTQIGFVAYAIRVCARLVQQTGNAITVL